MMNGQSYAINIEHILCNVFECERFGFGGVVNSDFIRRQPFAAMLSGLGYLYANSDSEKKKLIENFIEKNSFYSKMSVDELLSFVNRVNVIDGIEIDIGFENGVKAIEYIVEEFEAICK